MSVTLYIEVLGCNSAGARKRLPRRLVSEDQVRDVPYSLGATVDAIGILALVKNDISSNFQLQTIIGVFGDVALTLVFADVGIY